MPGGLHVALSPLFSLLRNSYVGIQLVITGYFSGTGTAAYAGFNSGECMKGPKTLIERAYRARKNVIIIYAEFHYLLTLSEVIFIAFSVDFQKKTLTRFIKI